MPKGTRENFAAFPKMSTHEFRHSSTIPLVSEIFNLSSHTGCLKIVRFVLEKNLDYQRSSTLSIIRPPPIIFMNFFLRHNDLLHLNNVIE